MTPITEERLLAVGFVSRPKRLTLTQAEYWIEVSDTDPPEGESCRIIIEKGNGTNEACWNVAFIRTNNEPMCNGAYLRHGIRFMEEVEGFIALWNLNPPPVETPVAGSSRPRDGHLKIEWLPDPRFAKGGQQVGVPSRRLRVTHLPTGLAVERWVDRSQTLALVKAKSMLELGLAEEGWTETESSLNAPDHDEGFGYSSWKHLVE